MDELNEPTSNPDNYKWGVFYCNDSDRRIFVPKRIGIGYTLNFCKPYVLVGFLLAIILIIVLSNRME